MESAEQKFHKLNNLNFQLCLIDYEPPFYDELDCDSKDCIFRNEDGWCNVYDEAIDSNLKPGETN